MTIHDLTPGTVESPDNWCTCGHARDEHGETGTCLGNHRIENPDFFPGEAFIDDAECYCVRFEFWYADEHASQP